MERLCFCEKCKETFPDEDSLETHLWRKHPIQGQQLKNNDQSIAQQFQNQSSTAGSSNATLSAGSSNGIGKRINGDAVVGNQR